MSNLVFIISFNLFGLLLILFIIFSGTLKKEAPEKYKELGSPTLFGISSDPSKLIKFFKEKEYESLENKFIKRLSSFFVIIFGLLFVAMLIGLIQLLLL